MCGWAGLGSGTLRNSSVSIPGVVSPLAAIVAKAQPGFGVLALRCTWVLLDLGTESAMGPYYLLHLGPLWIQTHTPALAH